MLIEIKCANFSNFDAALGRYVECGEKMIVSEDQVGQFVNCKKCNQPIEVTNDGQIQRDGSQQIQQRHRKVASKKDERRTNSASSSAASSDAASQRPNRSTGIEGKTKKNASNTGQRSSRRMKPGRSTGSKKMGAGKSTSDVMSLDFNEQHVNSRLADDRAERCRKCGNVVDSGQCTVCKYVHPKFEKLHKPLDELDIEITGFQRWFCQTMNEGVSVKVLEYGAHIMLGIWGVFMMMAALLGILGFGVSRTLGVVMLIAVVMGAFLYIGLVYKGHQFLRDPNARLAWFQKPFWNLLLLFSRMMKWQNYDARLKGRGIIKVRERFFRDEQILELEGIKSCQVLDLQGTSITDRGLLDLYGLKQLQCVVLKKTDVSHEAVFRLQQTFPRLWIWY